VTHPPASTKPDYGIDAPGVVRNLFLASFTGLTAFFTTYFGLWSGVAVNIDLANTGLYAGIGCGLMGFWMIYDSMIGKLKERERLLDLVALTGGEQILDVGCGGGLLLVGAAKRLSSGRAVGLDLWSAEDLTGKKPEVTVENARREGVAQRVKVQTGDMREMPFKDGTFDVVVSNVAIHNIYDREGRAKAVGEIARVLKPGGRLMIHDIRHVKEYAVELSRVGFTEVKHHGSPLMQGFLFLVTFSSLRPDILTARKPINVK
jgi:arsenite methyltransferase